MKDLLSTFWTRSLGCCLAHTLRIFLCLSSRPGLEERGQAPSPQTSVIKTEWLFGEKGTVQKLLARPIFAETNAWMITSTPLAPPLLSAYTYLSIL